MWNKEVGGHNKNKPRGRNGMCQCHRLLLCLYSLFLYLFRSSSVPLAHLQLVNTTSSDSFGASGDNFGASGDNFGASGNDFADILLLPPLLGSYITDSVRSGRTVHGQREKLSNQGWDRLHYGKLGLFKY